MSSRMDGVLEALGFLCLRCTPHDTGKCLLASRLLGEKVARDVGHHCPGISCSLFLRIFTLGKGQNGENQLDELVLCQQCLASAVFPEKPFGFPSVVLWSCSFHKMWKGCCGLKTGSNSEQVTSSTACSGRQKMSCSLDNLWMIFQLEIPMNNEFIE